MSDDPRDAFRFVTAVLIGGLLGTLLWGAIIALALWLIP